jgi:competence protein ComEC
MRAPAVVAVVPLLAGSAAGFLLWSIAAPHLPLCAAACAILAALAAAAWIDSGFLPEASIALALGFALAGVSLGVTAGGRTYRPSLLEWFGRADAANRPLMVEGCLREDAVATRFGVTLTVDVLRVFEPNADEVVARSSTGGVRISVSGNLAAGRIGEWRAGRRIRATTTLREPAYYVDPGVSDDRIALARRGIVLVGSVKSAALVQVIAPGSRLDETAAIVRLWTRSALHRTVGRWSVRSAGIATAVILGDRTGLDEADTRRLQEAGTYHVIAISGGNVAIFAAIVLMVLRSVRVPVRGAAIATALCLLVYGRIVVPAASVDRALTAAVLYLAARAIDHRGSALNVLATTAGCGVVAEPSTLVDPGFALSFGATLGILLGASRLMPASNGREARLRRAWRLVAGLLASTAAAEAAILPIGAAVFGRVTFAGLILNFAAIPLMSLLQAAALAAIAVVAISAPLGLVAGYVCHIAATALVGSARLAELTPWLVRDVPAPAFAIVVLYYAALTIALSASRPRMKRIAVTVAIAAAVVISAGPQWSSRETVPALADRLRVVFLDVGQGDATAVITPGGHAILVDAGGLPAPPLSGAGEQEGPAFDVGERVVVPALRAFGVRRLDALVLTHGDPDHIGGAPAVLRSFHPRTVWEGVPVPPHLPLRAVAALADAAAASWRTVQTGDLERFGAVTLHVLHPPRPEWERQRVRNEDSIVLEVRFGEISIILPGDIGAEGEHAAVSWLPASTLTILKAPHHGSATSSTPVFLDALHPRAVIFSAGRHNRFGHPAPAVVARYRSLGVAMFSTAEDGAVIVETDGTRVEIKRWKGETPPVTLRPD